MNTREKQHWDSVNAAIGESHAWPCSAVYPCRYCRTLTPAASSLCRICEMQVSRAERGSQRAARWLVDAEDNRLEYNRLIRRERHLFENYMRSRGGAIQGASRKHAAALEEARQSLFSAPLHRLLTWRPRA